MICQMWDGGGPCSHPGRGLTMVESFLMCEYDRSENLQDGSSPGTGLESPGLGGSKCLPFKNDGSHCVLGDL
jgi:hypothetical protein